uniref:Serine/threonine-protein kinase receptor n=1 Tax=Panagrolaimus sp. PS1159 TaxID=55785 RepID=A0AC35GE62_9BILA
MHPWGHIFQSTSIFILLLICNYIVVGKCSNDDNTFFPEVKFDPDAKKQEILDEPNKISLPYYYKKYGKQGKNFDLDEKGNPFIWCEQFDGHICTADNISDCLSMVKCFPELRSHHLGCMAVLVYNSNTTSTTADPNNVEDILQKPALKGCWSQDESQLGECTAHDECLVNTRNAGSKDRTYKFCCCRTHNCNKVLKYGQEPDIKDEDTPAISPKETAEEREDREAFIRFMICVAITIIGFLCLVMLIVFVFLHYRRKMKNSNKDNGKNDLSTATAISLGRMDYNRECMAFIGDKLEDLRKTELVQKISKGRFGEVFRGHLNGTNLAVKLCTNAELDSWINEQDVYAVKIMRQHDNISEFVASFEYDRKYWLITKYYEFGSLFDYLKQHTVSLVECSKIISGFLNGLAFLHEERDGKYSKPTIVHRDFKSKNVLIKDNLTSCISDFGLAMKYDGNSISVDELHGQVGTRRYMSPEVLEGATEFSAFAFQQIDVYAASLVMWEVLNRTEVKSCVDMEPFGVPPSRLPYEDEIGLTPTLGRIRELVVINKYRPQIRECLHHDKTSKKLMNTMIEMWEMEPDGRITSGCARDRVVRVYEELSGVPYKIDIEIPEEVLQAEKERYQAAVAAYEARHLTETVANSGDEAEITLINHRPINDVS